MTYNKDRCLTQLASLSRTFNGKAFTAPIIEDIFIIFEMIAKNLSRFMV